MKKQEVVLVFQEDGTEVVSSFMMQHMLEVVNINYVVNIYYLRSAAYLR
jgi:hypothetical protein